MTEKEYKEKHRELWGMIVDELESKIVEDIEEVKKI